MIFVVLGMHKSGTTLVSQILHHSGVNMGDFQENISYDEGNKYERESTLEVDMEILGAGDYRVLDLRSSRRLRLDEGIYHKMREIIAGCGSRYEDWGFKDPRALLLEVPGVRIIRVVPLLPECSSSRRAHDASIEFNSQHCCTVGVASGREVRER